ncbi:hypothetical protein [Piscinibacter sakaiensis]|uniref:Uncharacterized protein n=1 Tax=Piscinibacter sakaiensis TaxID=1547922 RepID=A0A0K8P584_PISS1|nr:hypothetical protein [Piscinibacter sakaiensis]GAP37659.1 hypothetical protein ISF6_3604 [Piscinibacter sakaiensis]
MHSSDSAHGPDPDPFGLHGLDVLLAGTVAMMTAWAEPCTRCAEPAQRVLLARRLVSNLFFLQQHPGLGPDVRGVLAEAQVRWQRLALQAADTASAAPPADAPTASTLPLH